MIFTLDLPGGCGEWFLNQILLGLFFLGIKNMMFDSILRRKNNKHHAFQQLRMWDPPFPEFVACDTKDKEGVPIHSCQVGGVG